MKRWGLVLVVSVALAAVLGGIGAWVHGRPVCRAGFSACPSFPFRPPIINQVIGPNGNFVGVRLDQSDARLWWAAAGGVLALGIAAGLVMRDRERRRDRMNADEAVRPEDAREG